MAAPPPPDPAVLMVELVEEFLLRLPPEDLAPPSFREFHRSTPLLGYILNLADSIRFLHMSSFRPSHAHRGGVRAVSSSHGRVLLHRSAGENLYALRSTGKDPDVLLSVWDPITDEQQDLPVVPVRPSLCLSMANWEAVLIRANGEGCNHFKVVFVGKRRGTFSCFYSSEADSWSDPVFASEGIGSFIPGNCVLIENTFYSKCAASYDIFKYDMLTNQMCNIRVRLGPGVRLDDCMLIATEDGRLGVAKASNSTLLLWTHVGCFTIDLKSGSCKKVGEDLVSARVVPYVSFCTPAPGAVSTDEVPVADIAVSTDEGPGAGVAVFADEGPAAGMCQVPKKLKLQVQGPLNQEGN
ncbi:unnamed protein product [Miscanthus lutarioriparius]|uniref:DUF295 domain-containing protein n=1 Tax=Miscanthus lutarioriparius TaxID=422564 RepID=A0A811RBM4_9POAL|nr:unnamed protein product [Miscanthus lutarioriparius]